MATQASVAATMRKKGFAMTLTRTTRGTYDPISGYSGSSLTESTVYGFVKPFGVMTVAFSSLLTGSQSLIKSGDMQAIIEGIVAPVIGGTLALMGEVWSVVNFDRISPQGEALLYKVHLRK